MSEKQTGPSVSLSVKCGDCAHQSADYYSCQSDWGYDYHCTHESVGKKPMSSGVYAPEWCPLRGVSIAKFLEALTQPPTVANCQPPASSP